MVGEQQVHGVDIQMQSTASLSPGSFTLIPGNDGILLTDPGALALAQSADCCIGLFIDPTRHLAGVFHAGWRGAVQGLPLRMVETCAAEFRVDPQDVWIALGPTIQQPSFQVGPEVRDACLKWNSQLPSFDHERLLQPDPAAPERWRLDLPGFVVAQLLAAGVLPEHLAVSRVDTFNSPTECFSYRREGPGMGLQVGFCGWQRVR
ncbi:MAG: Polyphenol oxidase [bacterium]|nr:Polyphenol oxidase [bacterium]